MPDEGGGSLASGVVEGVIGVAAMLASVHSGPRPAVRPGLRSEMPSRLWSGVTRLLIQCRSDARTDPGLRDRVCARALAEARAATRLAVVPLGPCETAPAHRDAAILTLHLSGTAAPQVAAAVRRAVEIDDGEAGAIYPPVALATGPDPLAPVARLVRRALLRSGRAEPIRPILKRGTP